MAADPEARKITINYDGGSIYMTIGSLKSLLGDKYETLAIEADDVTVEVDAHSRVRVIGGPSTQVGSHTYTFKSWPQGESAMADGGSVVRLSWKESDGWWTARINGPFYKLGTFLKENAVKPCFFTSERGTKYGPF